MRRRSSLQRTRRSMRKRGVSAVHAMHAVAVGDDPRQRATNSNNQRPFRRPPCQRFRNHGEGACLLPRSEARFHAEDVEASDHPHEAPPVVNDEQPPRSVREFSSLGSVLRLTTVNQNQPAAMVVGVLYPCARRDLGQDDEKSTRNDASRSGLRSLGGRSATDQTSNLDLKRPGSSIARERRSVPVPRSEPESC